MKCPRCQQDNPSHAKFCLECGAPLERADHTSKPLTDLKNENDDLRHSLSEALEQQRATADILRVISSSPTDVTPVFGVIVEHACRLCDAIFANAVRFDGTVMHNMAQYGFSPEADQRVRRAFPMPPSRGSMSGRAILAGTIVHTEDARVDDALQLSRELAGLMDYRAQVSVPMLSDGTPVGAITVARRAAGRFPDRQIDLLRAFADQAVIAIENVRLFKELEARNGDLTQALDQQTATSEILKVISSSPTDVQPVFNAIAESARRLCDADFCNVARYEHGLIHL